MRTILHVSTVEELPYQSASGGIDGLKAEEFIAHKPDLHLVLVENSTLRARCSLWWRSVPLIAGERPACVGHFAAMEAADAAQLLKEACGTLTSHGASMAIGPLDGNTWRRYRLVTQRGEEPPFFLEPDNPDAYPHYFEAAGFKPLARYYSSLNDDLGRSVTLPTGQRHRLDREGIGIRHLDPGAFMDELSCIHGISLAGFRDNYLYSPISREEFIAMYARVQPHVQPELVLMAELAGKPVGFIFAMPDMLRIQNGNPADTVILKSMAVLPEMAGRGIGALLMTQVSGNAHLLGFKRSIHALMHENNRSRGMSGHYGREIRQYTLYSRKLP